MLALDADLRSVALRVNEVGYDNKWTIFHRPGGFAPIGVMVHHTAGTKSLSLIVNGRPDLDGPLANFHVPKSGEINLVSGGRCNHAGAGAQRLLDRIRTGQEPLGNASTLGYVDGPNGNGLFYGIEAENLGNGRDPWPEEQINAIALLCAQLCRRHGWGPERVVAHREWTRRKIDPTYDIREIRRRVRWLLATWAAKAPTPTPPVALPAPPAPTRHEEDMATTHPIIVPLDNEGRGNITTGLALSKLMGKPWIQVPVRPNWDGYYPGDPDKIDPRNYESDDGGNLCVIVRGGPKTTDPARPQTLTVFATIAD